MGLKSPYRPIHEPKLCQRCQRCRLLCPDLAISRNSDSKEISIDLRYCKGCRICAAFCPKGAIRMVPELKPEEDDHIRGC